jgi:phage gpG-like protein
MAAKLSVKVKKKGPSAEDILARLRDPRPLLDVVGQLLVTSTRARLRTTKSDPRGGAWAPWAPSTYRARSRSGLAGGLLVDSGRLLNSIDYQVQGRQVVVGARDVPYAQFLQGGTSRMPARPFVGVSDGDRTAIQRAAERYLLRERA